MKMSELKKVLSGLLKAGLVPLVQGPPGIGKTDAMGQVASDLGWDYLDCFAASKLPEHFGGYPFMQDGKADFLPLGILREMVEARKPVLVFIDELDKCQQGLQNAIAQLVYGRKVGEQAVSKHCHFVLAGNRPEDRAGGVRIVKHLIERVVCLTLECDHEAWLEWALEKDVNPMIRAYISRRPEGLLDYDPARPDNAQTNPRKWAQLSKAMEQLPQMPLEAVRGILHERQAVEFAQFQRLVNELPSYDEVIADPSGAKVPEKGDCQYAIAAMMAQNAKVGDAAKVAEYIARLNVEIAGFAYHSLGKRDKEFARNPAFIKWALSVGVELR
jgi:hypothetical protein